MARTRKWKKGLATFSNSTVVHALSMRGEKICPRVNRPTRISPKSSGPEVGKRGLLHNTVFSCCDFYEKIKSNKDFMKKILSTEKHELENV